MVEVLPPVPLAVDVSSWGGPLTDAEAQCLKESGYSKVIVNSYGPEARGQLETAYRHAFALEIYTYLYWDGQNPGRVRRAEAMARGLPIRCHWLDVEERPIPADFEAQYRAAIEVALLPVGVYTGYYVWPDTGNSRAFVHLPLWIAKYTGGPTLADCPELVPGWKPTMKQFGGTREICGQSCDVNFYEEETVTREQALAIIREVQKRQKERAEADKEMCRFLWDGFNLGPYPPELA